MKLVDIQNYLIPGIILVFFLWRFLKFRVVRSRLPALAKSGAVFVDVRSQAEFRQRSRSGTINIPLGEIQQRLKELDKSRTVVLCCASGARSSAAARILKKNGFTSVVNAGPWINTPTTLRPSRP